MKYNRNNFRERIMYSPASAQPIAARSPAPPAPITSASYSWSTVRNIIQTRKNIKTKVINIRLWKAEFLCEKYEYANLLCILMLGTSYFFLSHSQQQTKEHELFHIHWMILCSFSATIALRNAMPPSFLPDGSMKQQHNKSTHNKRDIRSISGD